MDKHAWSPSTLQFYPLSLKDSYVQAGTWPDDTEEVSEDVFKAFALTKPPEGKMRGAGLDRMPAWIDRKA